jgi:sporulation protein YlmC with PRC-barrel domain
MSRVASIPTGTLIAAEKVNGTAVYNADGEKLGSIDGLTIDKVSG